MFSFNRNHKSLAHNDRVSLLIQQMSQSQRESVNQNEKNVRDKRKMYTSLSLSADRKESFANRPKFKHNTKQGEFIDKKHRSNPYVFIPGYKNNNFIMPDKVFEKGKAGKRFFIKMKDTSVYSFKDPQNQKTSKAIDKQQKQKTIMSRKVEEYDRIIDNDDGRKKNQLNKWFLKTRKIFTPTNPVGYFTTCCPMMQPKQQENKQIKKISLAKTYDYRKKWRPATRGADVFSATATSFSNTTKYAASFS